MKIQFYSALFWGIVLTLTVWYLTREEPILNEIDCKEIVQVWRTGTYSFPYCADNDSVYVWDEWRQATFIEKRLYEMQFQITAE